MDKHTPWDYVANLSGSENHKGFALKAGTSRIGEIYPLDENGDEGNANAAFIVRAVNSHEHLLRIARAYVLICETKKHPCNGAKAIIAKAEGK